MTDWAETRDWLQANGFAAQDEQIWIEALTHGSVGRKVDYQRLEFLGDRVLGLSIAEWLFELRDGGCGPTVPLACSDALRFACSHLEMPDVTRHQVVSRQVLAHQRATARPLKPARPPAPEHVSLLEHYINNATVPIERRWTAAVVWLQVFAALRFDDAQHSSPGELRFTEQGIFGRSSTSKTDKFNRSNRRSNG